MIAFYRTTTHRDLSKIWVRRARDTPSAIKISSFLLRLYIFEGVGGTVRIVHVIASLGLGGAEANLCSLVEESGSRGFRHTVITMLPDGALRPRLERAGATIIELSGLRGALGLVVL